MMKGCILYTSLSCDGNSISVVSSFLSARFKVARRHLPLILPPHPRRNRYAPVYLLSKDVYKRQAQGESFVVLGRCGEQVLKNNPNCISIFICGNPQFKLCLLYTS